MDPLKKAVELAREGREPSPGRALVGPLGIDHIRYTQTRVVPFDAERAEANYVVAHLERDPAARVFSTLAMQVVQKMRRRSLRSIAVVGPSSGAGSSLVAANLAIALAREPNQTVLAVDADLRTPTLAARIGFDPQYGLADHLVSSVPMEQLLVNPGLRRLVVVPGRNSVEDADELLASRRMADAMRDWHDRYENRVVLYDCAPLLGSADTLALLPNVDCALLVLREGRTTGRELETCKRLLGDLPMVGAVVNEAPRGLGRR
jgi:Mrp family chromosome partitioning ATPase